MTDTTENRYRAFANEYIIDFHGTKAAIRAGYAPDSAHVQASRLLKNDNVQQYIAEAIEKRSERVNVKQDFVLEQLLKLASVDIRNAVKWGRDPADLDSEYADPNGLNVYPVRLVPSENLDADTAAAISEVSLTQTGVKVKMYDKLAALDKLARHLGMYLDRTEHSVSDDLAALLKEIDGTSRAL